MAAEGAAGAQGRGSPGWQGMTHPQMRLRAGGDGTKTSTSANFWVRGVGRSREAGLLEGPWGLDSGLPPVICWASGLHVHPGSSQRARGLCARAFHLP